MHTSIRVSLWIIGSHCAIGFMKPSEVSGDSSYNGAREFVNGKLTQPQITHNEETTRGSKV